MKYECIGCGKVFDESEIIMAAHTISMSYGYNFSPFCKKCYSECERKEEFKCLNTTRTRVKTKRIEKGLKK